MSSKRTKARAQMVSRLQRESQNRWNGMDKILKLLARANLPNGVVLQDTYTGIVTGAYAIEVLSRKNGGL